MNPHLGADAMEFGEVAARAFADAGGADLARRVEADHSLRTSTVAPLVDQLGVQDLDPASDVDDAEAAAVVCRAAGAVALPYPIVPALLGHLALRSRRNEPRDPGRGASSSRVDHAHALDEWRVSTIDGDAQVGRPSGDPLASKLGPFVGDVELADGVGVTPVEIALHLTLTSFVIAGGLRRTVDLATAHVVDRVQFDKPLSSFQAVQFQLADAHVAVTGVDELAQFALWRCHKDASAAIVDALAARLGAVDAARTVLRITQQLHGASGMCDEYDVSIIARHLQPALRLPFGAESTAAHVADAVERLGFDGLFAHGGHGVRA